MCVHYEAQTRKGGHLCAICKCLQFFNDVLISIFHVTLVSRCSHFQSQRRLLLWAGTVKPVLTRREVEGPWPGGGDVLVVESA